MASGDHIVKAITQKAFKNGRDLSSFFTEMLDKFIDFLSYERLQENGCDESKVMESIKDDEFFELFTMWIEWVNTQQSLGRCVDAFDFYEGAVKSKGKADMLGQFYTPMPICDLMAEMIDEAPTEDVVTVLDCAVGSGRTLLGHANQFNKHKFPNVAYYVGNDIDSQSVKMCTLNLAINGLIGRVLLADGLILRYYGGYEINECRYPYWTNGISIRKLPDAKNFSSLDDIQNECFSYMHLEKERRDKLEALYQCRIGNLQPCIDMIPNSLSTIEKMIAERQIETLSLSMAEHYDVKPPKKEQEPQPIEAPKQVFDTSKMVQRSLFD